ncbi:MAG: PBP1A family penicillin-binding protein [Nitrospinae bacterium]|nr:PBP1A family penicillin-binding protein [Nitrospinota bacterium]
MTGRTAARRAGFGTRKLLVVLFALSVFGVGAVMGGGWFVWSRYAGEIPDPGALAQYQPSLVTRVYDANDALVAEYFVEKRILTPLDKIPHNLVMATIAVEDAHFFEHHGINFEGIVRAMFANLMAGRVVQGGSSITQQVAKQIFLSSERTFTRKIKEAILSLELERRYTKEEILEVYLNHIYYGHGAYGVEAAAQVYFGKSVGELSLAQMAMIAGLPKAPTNYTPFRHPERALDRRRHCLNRMVDVGAITAEQGDAAAAEPFNLAPLQKPLNRAPWFTELVRRDLEKTYGADTLYRGGLTVRTTLDLTLQEAAQTAMIEGLEATDKRLGYRGPLGKIDRAKGETPAWDTLNPKEDDLGRTIEPYVVGARVKGVVTAVDKEGATIDIEGVVGRAAAASMAWAHKADPDQNALWAAKMEDPRTILSPGDLVEVRIDAIEKVKTRGADGVSADGRRYVLSLDQTPGVQGALVAIDPRSGAVRALVGGYDPQQSSFNRATQALRQPGSSFKPIIYTAALANGFTPASVVIDAPIIYDRALNEYAGWKPMNFEQKFFGPTTLREAVTHSRNVVTIKVLEKIGVKTAIEYARRFGVETPLDDNLGLALGASPVRVIDMVAAYGTLANGGFRYDPMMVVAVEGPDGKVVESHEPTGEQVIDPAPAYLMANIMKSVVDEGTASSLGQTFDRPLAGKTGTTNNYNDAWFIGFTPDLACGVWVGRDDNTPLGRSETGSRAAIPIWERFMKTAVKGRAPLDFTPPPQVVFVRVDKKTGQPTRAADGSAFFEAFIDGTEPTFGRPATVGDGEGEDAPAPAPTPAP